MVQITFMTVSVRIQFGGKDGREGLLISKEAQTKSAFKIQLKNGHFSGEVLPLGSLTYETNKNREND